MTAFVTWAPLPLYGVSRITLNRCRTKHSGNYRRSLGQIVVALVQDDEVSAEDKEHKPRFDPESDMDAFGHDPKKATEFWRTSARDLLDSKEVKDAIEQHAANPTEVDDERAAYLKFIKELDENKDS